MFYIYASRYIKFRSPHSVASVSKKNMNVKNIKMGRDSFYRHLRDTIFFKF